MSDPEIDEALRKIAERMSHSTGDLVCVECFSDEGIREYVESCGESQQCDFCGDAGPGVRSVSLSDVAGFMEEKILLEYSRAVEELGFIDGEYIGIHWDTDDLFDHLGLDFPRDDKNHLRTSLVLAIGPDYWCQSNPYGLEPHEALAYSWEAFCERIKHRRRFFFLTDDQHTKRTDLDLIEPALLLERIGRACAEYGLIRRLPSGSKFFRARKGKGLESFTASLDFGPPPPERSLQANRMNPPGIPMLYVATSPNTAFVETAKEPGIYWAAKLVFGKELSVLDFSELPRVPGLFEASEIHDRRPLIFLHEFAQEIAKPVERDDRQHVEYVPTQVVTEYFRGIFSLEFGPIDGIVYPSTRDPHGKNLVLFAQRSDVLLRNMTTGELMAPEDPEDEVDPFIEVSPELIQFELS